MEQEIKEFSFTFEELKILPSEIEWRLGIRPGTAPEPFPGFIASALEEGLSLFDIRGGFRIITPVKFLDSGKQFQVENRLFSPGDVVFERICKSKAIAFFAATAGAGVSDRCRELTHSGEIIGSYVLDLLGSAVAEKAVEKLLDHLEKSAAVPGWGISESYTPGFCHWSVAEQQMLFSLLPQDFCGISLTPDSLMIPVKSISGIAGIGPALNRDGYQCIRCTDKGCYFGKLRLEKEGY